MKPKTIISELILLLSILFLAWLLAFWLTGTPKLDYHFDINLNDTYLVLKDPLIIITPLLILTMAIYLTRNIIFQFKKTSSNVVTIFILLLINILLSKLIKSAETIEAHLTGGWTIYPPLSALPKVKSQPSALNTISQILYFIQILFLFVLVMVAMLTGKNWKLRS